MRVSDSLLIPDELELARTSGELVVFAGAGISMGPPANLPNFRGLALEIAEPVVPWHDKYELQLDHYLGIAERAGVLVQQRAREKLIALGGSHTPLHEQLLRVFPNPENDGIRTAGRGRPQESTTR